MRTTSERPDGRELQDGLQKSTLSGLYYQAGEKEPPLRKEEVYAHKGIAGGAEKKARSPGEAKLTDSTRQQRGGVLDFCDVRGNCAGC